MTVTIVYGKTSDGYLTSVDANYTTARNAATADTLSAGNTGYYGQNNNGGTYTHHQTFIGFDYAAVAATEMVTAAAVRGKTTVALSSGVARSLELRGYAWSGGGLTTADWRDGTELAGYNRFGNVYNINSSYNKFWVTGSDAMLTDLPLVASMEFVAVTSRQRTGTVPTSDEGTAMYTADQAGTSEDPALVFTSLTRHALVPVLGAMAQLSDGTCAYLTSTGAATPTVLLRHSTLDGTGTTIATIPIGTGATDFAAALGAQGLALTVDSADNIYVLGKLGNASNSLAARAYVKGSGYTWTAGTVRSTALPTYEGSVNQVAVAWHNVNGGTLVALVGHTAGSGSASNHGSYANDLAYVLLSSAYLLTGAGSLVRASGGATGVLVHAGVAADYYNQFANEVGSGLDVVAARGGNAAWGYVATLDKSMGMGSNDGIGLSRYVLNATGTGFDHASTEYNLAWATKDAACKVRAVAISDTVTALVTADADPGYGITVCVQQHSGTDSGSVELGYINLDAESITGMPSAGFLATSHAWDVVYSATENRLWVYFRHTTNAYQVYRTAISLDTYAAVRNSVLVKDLGVGNTVQAIRLPRNGALNRTSIYSLSWLTGTTLNSGTYSEILNLAPTAPTLTPKTNFDATAATTFAWTHNDPNGDAQTSYELEIMDVSDGSTDVDTGKTASATQSRVLTAATLTNGKSYQWRVRTWDTSDEVSPWSAWGTFSTSAGGTVTITSPAVDNPAGVITDDYLITWSVSGTTQASYLVHLYRGGVLVSDSGWVAGTATSRLVSGMTSGVEHEVRVQVRNAALVQSGIGTRKITPDYSNPEVPTISVTPGDGYLEVVVNNPVPTGDRPEVNTNLVLRRLAGTSDPWEQVGTCDPDGTFQDHTAASGVTYAYKVRGVSA